MKFYCLGAIKCDNFYFVDEVGKIFSRINFRLKFRIISKMSYIYITTPMFRHLFFRFILCNWIEKFTLI